jgi:outer membrane protein assembly factor BamE
MSQSFISPFVGRLPLLLTLPVAWLAGCSAISTKGDLLGLVTPYRLEVVQGNVITKEQAVLVRPGLSRAQVRDVLGSALLADAFHGNRWDYVFTIRRQGAEPQLRRVVVFFKDDKLDSVDTGGDLPSERDFVALIDTYRPPSKPPELALTDEQLKALPQPPQQTAPAAESTPTPPPTRSYPPLEPTS